MSRLTSAQWGELADRVKTRDLRQRFLREGGGLSWDQWIRINGNRNPCVVWLDPSGWGICSGHITMNHVKPWPAMSYPREKLNSEEFLTSVCEYHHLWSQKGRNWATSHLDTLREYLKGIYDPTQDLPRETGGQDPHG